jgi:glycosyltransferase involved in cell wall biosynthesis
MQSDLISILIPCYNTENYLKSCLDCVLGQTYTNIEVLFLDDGSTDTSLKIMQEYKAKDDRISIISRENRGVSASRNELMEKCNGKYVMFVDSDDLIAPNIVEALYKAITENNCELAMCNILKWYEGEKIDTKTTPELTGKNRIYTPDEALLDMIIVGDHFDFPTAKLIKKDILKGIEFPLNRVYEDTATLYKIYSKSQKSIYLDDKLYYHLEMRPESITTKKYTLKNLNDNYLAIRERYEHLLKTNPLISDDIKLGYIRNSINLLCRVFGSGDNEIINHETTKSILAELPSIYSSIQNYKNRNRIINNYRLSCLFLIIEGKIDDFKRLVSFVERKDV